MYMRVVCGSKTRCAAFPNDEDRPSPKCSAGHIAAAANAARSFFLIVTIEPLKMFILQPRCVTIEFNRMMELYQRCLAAVTIHVNRNLLGKYFRKH